MTHAHRPIYPAADRSGHQTRAPCASTRESERELIAIGRDQPFDERSMSVFDVSITNNDVRAAAVLDRVFDVINPGTEFSARPNKVARLRAETG